MKNVWGGVRAWLASADGRRMVTILVGLMLGAGSVVVVVDGDGEGPSPAKTITLSIPRVAGVPVATAGPDTKPDAVVTAAPIATHEEGLRSEAAQTEEGRQLLEDLAAVDALPVTPPLAAPSQRGCVSRFLQVNHSSRRGLAPRELVWHLTVSRNVPGWSDVLGIVSFFGRPSTEATSNFVLDGEGHCAYIVREVDKAWTQAAANPFSISVEVIDMGTERVYLATRAARRQAATIALDVSRRWSIPLRVGRVVNCLPVTPGNITHAMLGACGGGHVDIGKFSVRPILREARAMCAANARRYRYALPERCRA